jgi:hypothetical protein
MGDFRAGLIRWIITLTVLGVLLAGVYYARILVNGPVTAEKVEAQKKLEGGRIKLGAKEAELNTQVEKIKDIEWHPKVPVYGRVINNPDAITEMRAAWAGRLGSADGKWPSLAAHVKGGEVLGFLEVRPPQDRLDLVSKRNEARLKLEGARTIWAYQHDRVKRFESAPTSFARSEMDAALVALADAQTQVAINEAAAKLWQDALAAFDQNGDLKQITWTLPLITPANGEITELGGRPGTTVEAGSLIAKIVDFRKTLIRVDIPLSTPTAPPPTLTFSVPGAGPPGFDGPNNRPEPPEPSLLLKGELIGAAAQVDQTQAAGYLYKVSEKSTAAKEAIPVGFLRPGLFVKAQLEIQGKVVSGLSVPKSALVYHQGRALVYIELPSRDKAGEAQKARFFQRVEVSVLARDGNTWIVNGSLVEGDLVVIEGALYLLSAEFRTDSDDY